MCLNVLDCHAPCSHYQEVTQLELEVHMEAFHMVDTTTIDWTKPVAGQVGSVVCVIPIVSCY